ncbi:MAG: hypothetical protein RH945_10850 [Hyphomonas sp.]|tara:strand:- start:14327 stop:14596 length:270 start_codon:yes stop_codon:yes gene_type:complete
MPFADYAIDLESMLGPDSAPEELYQAGLVYATGLNVDVDLIAAHKWFNLAALRGSDEAKIQRAEMADMMSTDEVKQALQSAREWLKLMH